MNAYSLDLRKLVVAFVEEGHSQAEAARQFKLHPETVSKWIKFKNTTGDLKAIPVPRSPHKLPLDALEEYVNKHPDAFLREITEFHCFKPQKTWRVKVCCVRA